MHTPLRSTVITAMLCSFALAGCAKPASSMAGPTDDPCALVTKSEVRDVFPGAESGKRDPSTDQYGIASCKWELPTATLAVQIFRAKSSASEELHSRMSGFLDPLQPALRQTIQYDTVAGLGDEAVVVAVKADQAQGVFADSAMLGIRHGDRMAVLFTSTLVDGDPAATKKALEALGRSAAARL